MKKLLTLSILSLFVFAACGGTSPENQPSADQPEKGVTENLATGEENSNEDIKKNTVSTPDLTNKNLDLLNQALENQDYSACDGISDTSEKESCLSKVSVEIMRLAAEDNNKAACSSLRTSSEKGECESGVDIANTPTTSNDEPDDVPTSL